MVHATTIPQDLWKQIETTVSADYRMRFERRIDKDFQQSANDNRSDLHQRGRIGVTLAKGKKISAFLQYQYAHTTSWSKPANNSKENSDLFQASVQIKESSGTLTLGRQRINLGSERLIGSIEWLNVGRSYDAVRFENKEWDVFAGVIAVQVLRPRYLTIAGVSHKHSAGVTSAIVKHDKGTGGDIDLMTLAHAYRKHSGNFDFEAEGALQWGAASGKDHEAWAIHAQATRKLAQGTAATLEFNSASGGGSASTSRTFDNLYPTNHKFYGLMDLHSWKNLDMLALSVTHSVNPSIHLKFRAATSQLRDSKDAWYGASGLPNRHSGGAFIDPSGTSGKDLGRELDLELIWKRNPKQTISAGFGAFLPGSFVKKVSGDNEIQYFGYLMFGVRN